MKDIVKKCVFLLGHLFFFYPWLASKFSFLFSQMYTGMLSSSFFYFGKGTFIAESARFVQPKNISIGINSYISRFCYIESTCKKSDSPILVIGDDCNIGEFSHISGYNLVKIGSGLLTGRFVLITDNSHGLTDRENMNIRPIDRPLISKGPIIIGNNVWIGDKVTILPNVKIGDGVVIGANSVVGHDIPSYTVYVGKN